VTFAEERMKRIVSPGRIAAAAFASAVLWVGAVRAAVVVPLPHRPELQAVADRVHALTVQIRARAFIAEHPDGGLRMREAVSSVSGVMVGDGLVLTVLSAVALPGRDGGLQPVNEIEVSVDDVGSLPARLVAGDTGLDVAILELPGEARALPGASLAAEDPNAGDAMLAIGVDGDSITAVGVSLERVGLGDDASPRLQIDHALPPHFFGGPLFDDRGHLVGIASAHPGSAGGTAVPASLLRSLLRRFLGGDGI
jgi:S1-C subfamily serine protease